MFRQAVKRRVGGRFRGHLFTEQQAHHSAEGIAGGKADAGEGPVSLGPLEHPHQAGRRIEDGGHRRRQGPVADPVAVGVDHKAEITARGRTEDQLSDAAGRQGDRRIDRLNHAAAVGQHQGDVRPEGPVRKPEFEGVDLGFRGGGKDHVGPVGAVTQKTEPVGKGDLPGRVVGRRQASENPAVSVGHAKAYLGIGAVYAE